MSSSSSEGFFVHLGARSDFSTGESLARVDQLCRAAARAGQPALALADRQSLAGAPELQAHARAAGIRPVFGVEAHVLPPHLPKASGALDRVRLLASNAHGWRRLVELVNLANDRATATAPAHLVWDDIVADTAGLFILLGGPHSPIASAAREKRLADIEAFMEQLVERVPAERLLIALPAPVTPDAARLARLLATIAEHFQLDCVAVPEVHCAASEDDIAWCAWANPRGVALHAETTLGDLRRPPAQRSHLLTTAEARALYADFPGVVENTALVAAACDVELPRTTRAFPALNFQRGVDPDSFIWNEIFTRASQRYGDMPSRWRERLNREFRDLVAADLPRALTCLARFEEQLAARGILRGPGAGFLTHSLVASLLGITGIDPLRFDLPFTMPEGARQRPRVELTIPTSALDDAGAVLLELFDGFVAPAGRWQRWTIATALDELITRIDGLRATEAHKPRSPEWRRAWDATGTIAEGREPDADWTLDDVRALAWITRRIEGRARRLRAIGPDYVFTHERLARTLPVARTPEGHCVTEWDSAQLEDLGLGRLVFSRDPVLDLVDEANRWLRYQGQRPIDPADLPPDDAPTFRLLREARTNGIPLLESPGMRRRLRMTPPASLAELLRLIHVHAGAPDVPPSALPPMQDILLALWAAAIKSHEPAAFFAAALTLNASDTPRAAALLDDARRHGLAIRPLDVNLSVWRWAPEDARTLRPGLLVVHNLTAAAGHEIERARTDFAFADMPDLLRRTDPRILRTPMIDSLIRAGALDTIATTRHELLLNLPRLDELLRPRRARNADSSADPLQFFNHGTDWWLQNHALDSEWQKASGEESLRDLAAAERIATGLVLVAGHEELLPAFTRTAGIERPAALQPRDRGRVVTLLSAIDSIEDIPGGPGTTDGVIVDIGGVQLTLRGMPAHVARRVWREGTNLLAAGVFEREGQQWILDDAVVAGWEDALHLAESAEALVLKTRGLDANVVRELHAILKSHPGPTPVRLAEDTADRATAKLATRRITICPGLEYALRRLLPPGTWTIPTMAPSGVT